MRRYDCVLTCACVFLCVFTLLCLIICKCDVNLRVMPWAVITCAFAVRSCSRVHTFDCVPVFSFPPE